MDLYWLNSLYGVMADFLLGSHTMAPYSIIDFTNVQYKDFIGVTNLNSLQILFIKNN
jgi:hypothetical protein